MKNRLLSVLLIIFGSTFLLVAAGTDVGAITIVYPEESVFPESYGTSWDNPVEEVDDVLQRLYPGDVTLRNVNGFSGEIETWFATGAATLILEEIAGYEEKTAFGWYATDNSDAGQLFSGSSLAGDSASITFFEPKDFGFYIDPNGIASNRMYTEHALNAGDFYQVVIFQIVEIPNQYILGWEDLVFNSGDKDYQDLIVRATINPVPEPATMLLLGSGLIGLAGLGRKKFFKKKS